MRTNSRGSALEKDKIFDAVAAKMTEKGKGFFIISCGPWIHPLNTVLNCYAIMFDGFIQYKFELTEEGKFKVAQMRGLEWLDINVKVGDVLTEKELIDKIRDAK